MTFQGSPLGGSGFHYVMILFAGLPGFVKAGLRTGVFLGTFHTFHKYSLLSIVLGNNKA
ncbi:hypothetical protein [Paenibacillus kribbensis]|uniref:hypothetical protein n=1 Tax=Paenibacillus kribbensis TaxID=172713 RepID=UPI0015B89854|nr:hypothetical protein [Paenibacillus kribbensis]